MIIAYNQYATKGSYVPSAVDYTGNGGAGMMRRVSFTYTPLSNVITRYVDGVKLTTDRLLNSITTRKPGKEI